MSKTTANKPKLVQDDPWLEPYTEEINGRISRFQSALKEIESASGSLVDFAGAYKEMGLHLDKRKKRWVYKEWAPEAHSLHLVGEFNHWNRESHPLSRGEGGIWEISLPEEELTENSLFKVQVVGNNGTWDRLPAYARLVEQDPETHLFSAVALNEKAFRWGDKSFSSKKQKKQPIIYEGHVGMGSEEAKVGSYREFADDILPRIKSLGYNTVQLMAIAEHPYYGSFGYHVSNFFAPSSRFGNPNDFKYLVNKAHKLDLAIVIDLVHSHAVKNLAEGINEFDGSDHQYFHAGGRGNHDAWDSKLFNYGKWEVKQFLLSNVRYWMEEYHVDGFRFDGITSLMYLHHGDHVSFDHYDKYFVDLVDWDALSYLQLANTLAHEINPEAITIAEDMSGMPGLCRPVKEGGLGFDFRLQMGIPDFWIKYLKHKNDEDWNVQELWSVMTNRRYQERSIAYAESHDQAIVGDKTVAFWLMDKEMYWHMSKEGENLIIDRGIALHKMIRLFTMSLGGEGYLNFMGNEFGHPEWIDFPREGNNWSYQHARRQWSLADAEYLKYHYLKDFDAAMIDVISQHKTLTVNPAEQLNLDEVNNTIIFKRGDLIFVFNFHPENAIPAYQFWVPEEGDYKIILSSDDPEYGGFNRVNTKMVYTTNEEQKLSIYLTNRTALVFQKVKKKKKK
ncbi:alpha amylase C-terminal domain-containing protein [Persicobacter diffluens]|uniref:1,4-alpha-glucan branching enzyme n=1 Tax=Persicobacter diffluens TaxID=981 RepID=A0AAN5AMY2_9BACT|nr:1,4-alpha-glucan branching enzyme [Persicobacter diffluens]